MDDFESVYLQDNFSARSQANGMDRLKIGEVFQIRQNQCVFVCIHCSLEFQQFGRFAVHAQEHFQNALQWVSTTSPEKKPKDEEAQDIEWLFSDSSDCDEYDMQQPPEDTENETHINNYVDIEMDNNVPYEQDECISLENRFKLKHPLIRVKDTNETRKFLPYFAKKYLFKRTDQRFNCPLCDYQANSKVGVREHLFVHSEIKIFECKLCNKDFNRPRNLREHIEQKHSEVTIATESPLKKLKIERNYDIGSEHLSAMVSPKLMTEHEFRAKHNSYNHPRTECLICKKTFSRPNGILKHMKGK